MVNVRYAWVHVAELCQQPHHEKCFASGESSMQFIDEEAALDQFARWNGPGRCFHYAPCAVEKACHLSKYGAANGY